MVTKIFKVLKILKIFKVKMATDGNKKRCKYAYIK